jgi:ectoine hydroxylase-related dioxygenase (phytanoyl-CoA dioxygenase family)
MNKLKKIKKSYLKNGYAVLKNYIPKNLIKEMLNDTKKLKESKKAKKNIFDIHYLKTGELSSIHNIANYFPKYKKFATKSKVIEVFREIYGPASNDQYNLSYFNKPKKKGVETKIHQDNAYFLLKPAEACTFWIPTCDVTKKNSAMFYYAGSQKEGLLEHKLNGNPGASLCISNKIQKKIEKKYKKNFISMKKGDCIIHSPLVIHGASSNQSSINRGSFNFNLRSKKAKPNHAELIKHKNKLVDRYK